MALSIITGTQALKTKEKKKREEPERWWVQSRQVTEPFTTRHVESSTHARPTTTKKRKLAITDGKNLILVLLWTSCAGYWNIYQYIYINVRGQRGQLNQWNKAVTNGFCDCSCPHLVKIQKHLLQCKLGWWAEFLGWTQTRPICRTANLKSFYVQCQFNLTWTDEPNPNSPRILIMPKHNLNFCFRDVKWTIKEVLKY